MAEIEPKIGPQSSPNRPRRGSKIALQAESRSGPVLGGVRGAPRGILWGSGGVPGGCRGGPWAILGRLGGSWDPLGASLGHLGGVLGRLGPLWDPLGGSWGASREPPGGLLEALGAILCDFLKISVSLESELNLQGLGGSKMRPKTAPGCRPGASWGPLGGVLGALEGSWGPLGGLLGPLGAV